MLTRVAAVLLLRRSPDAGFHMITQEGHPGYGFMPGQVTEWFYHDTGDIASRPTGPGCRRILIKP